MPLARLKDNGRSPLNLPFTDSLGLRALDYVRYQARLDGWVGTIGHKQFVRERFNGNLHTTIYGHLSSITFDTAEDMSFFILQIPNVK